MSEPLHIFISYAHADESFKNELTTMLALLRRQGTVKSWDDRQIDAGSDWRADIMGGMDRCDLALLLISPAFLASDFIQSVEMTHLLARRERDGIRVVPIILRPCPWHLDDIAQTQALPKDGKAVITFRPDNGERDQVWTDISLKIAGWAKAHRQAAEPAHAPLAAPAPVSTPSHVSAPPPAPPVPGQGNPFDPSLPKINPFNPWQPALPPHFYGREKILRQLDAALDAKRSVSIVGDWRIGKTSLLLTWQQIVTTQRRAAIFITGDGPEATSCGALVQAITTNSIKDSNNSDACADILATWALSQAAPPLILLDEAASMLINLPERFFERLRGMIGRGIICLVVASRIPIDAIYNATTNGSPFMNLLQQIRIGLLEKDAAHQLMNRGERRFISKHFEVLNYWAGCHPFFLTVFGWHLWENPCKEIVSVWQPSSIIDHSFDSLLYFRDEVETRLSEMWRSLPQRDQKILLQVANSLPLTNPNSSLKLRGLLISEGETLKIFGEIFCTWIKDNQS